VAAGHVLVAAATAASAGTTVYMGNKMLTSRQVTVQLPDCVLPPLELDAQTIDNATERDARELLRRDKWYGCQCEHKQEDCPK
jgi:hypothetical protein